MSVRRNAAGPANAPSQPADAMRDLRRHAIAAATKAVAGDPCPVCAFAAAARSALLSPMNRHTIAACPPCREKLDIFSARLKAELPRGIIVAQHHESDPYAREALEIPTLFVVVHRVLGDGFGCLFDHTVYPAASTELLEEWRNEDEPHDWASLLADAEVATLALAASCWEDVRVHARFHRKTYADWRTSFLRLLESASAETDIEPRLTLAQQQELFRTELSRLNSLT